MITRRPTLALAARSFTQGLLASLVALLLGSSSARADVPAYVPFQGFLTDELGEPIEGLTDITFSIYDRETGGTPLFTETRTIMVEQGFLNVFIGSVNTLDPDVFDHPTVFLGIKINSDGEMIDRTRLASVPYAFFANHCSDADTLDGMQANDFAPAAPEWSSIANRPAGLNDGDDNTTYSAGNGLSLGGTSFSIDPGYTQRRLSGSCSAGSSIRAIAQDGSVTCESDDDTNVDYVGVSGVSVSGENISIDPAYTQRRIAAGCNFGNSIRSVSQDGTVACETDNDTTYTQGSGLSLSGTQFSIDASYTQRRVSGTCSAGSSIRAILADGTVTCETDDDEDTTYSAAPSGGLSLNGSNQLSIAAAGVTSTMIADAAVTGTLIASNTITAGNIASNGVGSAEITSGAVGSSEIDTDAVHLDELADLPSGSALVTQTSLTKNSSYDQLAGVFTPASATRCLVTASAFVEHDGTAILPATFNLLGENDDDPIVESALGSLLPVVGQALTTTAALSASWTISATATRFGCRIGIPGDEAYVGGLASCQVSWVCF